MASTEIPVNFEFKGKQYVGNLSQVMGAGSNAHFHLMIDHSYLGAFFNTENFGWKFYGNVEGMEVMADYFEWVVISWYDCHYLF